jgi:hypothetical protein
MAKKRLDMSSQARARRIAKLVKNPRTRAGVKTRDLPPAMRKQREANRRLDDPNALVQDLTPRLLAEQTRASAEQRYAPAEQEIAGQRAVSGQVQRQIPSYFADYQAALQRATQSTQAGYAAAAAQQANTANSTAALDARYNAAQQQGQQQDAAARGAVADPNAMALAQQAAQARRGSLDTQAALTSAVGGAQVAFSANRERVGAGQKLQAQQGELARYRNIDKAAGALAREKGDYATTTRQKLLDAEHTKRLEKAAFGLNVEKAAADVQKATAAVKDRKAARATTNRNADQSRELQRATAAERLALERERVAIARSKAKSTGGSTVASQRDAKKLTTSVNTATADAKYLLTQKVETEKDSGKFRNLTESEVRAAIRRKYKDRDIANAAIDKAVLGRVSPENIKRLQRRNVKIPKEWLTTGKPGKVWQKAS